MQVFSDCYKSNTIACISAPSSGPVVCMHVEVELLDYDNFTIVHACKGLS